MKIFSLFIACFLLLLLVLWILGPRAVIKKEPSTVPIIPDDVDDFLKKREANTSEALKEDTEAKIIWAHPDKQKTEYSIVYLHGFSSSRKELSPVLETVASELHANLFLTRMRGHGSESGEMLKKVGIDDWMRDALEARAIGEKIGGKVILCGTSHGGLLANWVASLSGFKQDPYALILVSPNYAPQDTRARLLTKPWAKQILPLFFGKHRDWDPQNSGHEHYWNTVYPSDALFPMMAQVNHITPRSPGLLDEPCLVLYSTNDLTVQPKAIEVAYESFPTKMKKLVEIKNINDRQQHILAGDVLSPESTASVIHEILQFLKQIEVSEAKNNNN